MPIPLRYPIIPLSGGNLHFNAVWQTISEICDTTANTESMLISVLWLCYSTESFGQSQLKPNQAHGTFVTTIILQEMCFLSLQVHISWKRSAQRDAGHSSGCINADPLDHVGEVPCRTISWLRGRVGGACGWVLWVRRWRYRIPNTVGRAPLIPNRGALRQTLPEVGWQ